MIYASRILRRDTKGPDVQELQMRLAAFRGTVPDGDFGPGTELQVRKFQEHFMQMPQPSGVVDGDTFRAIDSFADRFPIDFRGLLCPCGVCRGFGQGRFKGRYNKSGSRLEAHHMYEYPGIHRMLLWAVRGLFFYMPDLRFIFSSGYRCGVRNEQTGRSSTNHCGKAVDLDTPLAPGEDRRDDMERCERIRGVLVEMSTAQIGWNAFNRKALEPSHIAPTWVHYDVRQYDPARYLKDEFFCTSFEQLNDRRPILV
jgi:hypothetical protein